MQTAPFGFLRLAAACPKVTVADPEANAGFLVEAVRTAQARGAQVLVLPELSLTGYTCADLFFSGETLVRGAERALRLILTETARLPLVFTVGMPFAADGRLFNVAAVCQAGEVLGLVPKSYLPNYKEFYEERWFSTAADATFGEVRLLGRDVPFGSDLLFGIADELAVTLAVEICEDLWAPVPPSTRHALMGATVLLCPSASDDQVGKAEWRRELVKQHSGRTLSAYAYANTGVHESSTDLVFGGHLLIAENGVLLAEGERFKRGGDLVITDVDTERLSVERMRQTTFSPGTESLPPMRRIELRPIAPPKPHKLVRTIEAHPFVPTDPATLAERCREIVSIQASGLATRLEHTRLTRLVLGLSGGLDSTLALLVSARAFDLLSLPRAGILAVTMPGFGTTDRTRESARRLAEAVRVELREIDIRPACTQHIQDIGLDPKDTSSLTFQNLQARERTQILMDLANKEGGLVVGTGDLSELALGFCTFAGDHISMYNVNAGVPKTLVRRVVAFLAEAHASPEERAVLQDVLATPVSPELLPPEKDGAITQKTEDIVGPYELHDFFLWGLVRLGAGPRKIQFLAEHAFAGAYDRPTLRKWLRVFVERFFANQFKRSMAPDGPKVGSVSLSPRGDWRMPSDASPAAFLRELDEA
jgi:NAD+ synthase (glutamine-hydrolysing)